MDVKELKEIIKDLPDETKIICQSDSEGNGYSPLAGVESNCVYVPENTWSGELHDINSEVWEDGEWEALLKEHGQCIVLWPTN